MSDLKTSQTHPLIVDEVAVPGTGGRIGMTLCPGRSDDQSIEALRGVALSNAVPAEIEDAAFVEPGASATKTSPRPVCTEDVLQSLRI